MRDDLQAMDNNDSGASAPSSMQRSRSSSIRSSALKAIKALHTLVWAVFASCIVAIPLAGWRGEYGAAAWLAAVVALEVAVLAVNRGRCPLTAVAARHTEDRRANLDIYLPQWLARHNKLIFGVLYLAGMAFAFALRQWGTE